MYVPVVISLRSFQVHWYLILNPCPAEPGYTLPFFLFIRNFMDTYIHTKRVHIYVTIGLDVGVAYFRPFQMVLYRSISISIVETIVKKSITIIYITILVVS